ncbi:MAG: FtsX-like permease family protein [Bacteroidetes bacterium]|nr:MAG: FtsX-like permease family protein [Bacteroidota bacterium]
MMRWILSMAWRDSRGSRRRLLLFVAAMVLGVAALVAINSFGENLRRAVDEEARSLLGADLSFEADAPFPPEVEALADSLGGRQARRVSFPSMALFPKSGVTRLATVRAHEGDYPFYGAIETDPPEAATTYQNGLNALVDRGLMQQFGVAVGDSVRIGRVSYRVAGALLKTPRESEVAMLFSPRIYIPLAGLDSTLLSRGSQADYEIYFKFDDERDVEALGEALRPRLRKLDVGLDTVAEVQGNWDEGLSNLYRFLSLIGFVALLLGSLGVASAVHVYVRQRVETVAVLRCFGARAWPTFGVYLTQAVAMGLVGALAGCVLGLGVQLLLPRVLEDFLPVEVAFRVSWRAVALGLGIGLGVTVLFALLPLVGVRRVSPLRALRSSYEPPSQMRRDPLRWGLYVLVAIGVTAFAMVQAPAPVVGVGYAVAIGVVFALLAGVARLIIVLVRRFFPAAWPYVWRQGLANLYRPRNQTLVLMLTLGFGTFLLMSLYVSERTLIRQVEIAGGEGQPNLVFFDVQPDQSAGVQSVLEQEGIAVIDRVPIVTMRIQAINGRTIEAMREDSTARLTWAHRREYRSTYRDYLTPSEEVVDGTFTGRVAPDAAVVPVSIERDIARDLGVALGDTIVFDVQGVPVTTVIGSIRAVEWRRMQTNFFFVFPAGVLEDAPQFDVVLARARDEAASAAAQAAVVRAYPNVAAIDLALVLDTFDAIFSRIAFVIRFMALFSILTGLVVLAASVLVSRYQRIEETVLLKTLGASRRQVLGIMAVEYLFLGALATLTGLVLALGGGWALARFVFDTPLVAPPLAWLVALGIVTGLTLLIGLLNSRGVYDRSALEVLRAEA